jgi:hypothetical protein
MASFGKAPDDLFNKPNQVTACPHSGQKVASFGSGYPQFLHLFGSGGGSGMASVEAAAISIGFACSTRCPQFGQKAASPLSIKPHLAHLGRGGVL